MQPLADDVDARIASDKVTVLRPGTALTATGLHLRLVDTGGAVSARLTGTRARLTLQDVRVDAAPGPPSGAVAAGFRTCTRAACRWTTSR